VHWACSRCGCHTEGAGARAVAALLENERAGPPASASGSYRCGGRQRGATIMLAAPCARALVASGARASLRDDAGTRRLTVRAGGLSPWQPATGRRPAPCGPSPGNERAGPPVGVGGSYRSDGRQRGRWPPYLHPGAWGAAPARTAASVNSSVTGGQPRVPGGGHRGNHPWGSRRRRASLSRSTAQSPPAGYVPRYARMRAPGAPRRMRGG
jgi:hypothetical protein